MHSNSVILFVREATGVGGGDLDSISAVIGNNIIPLRSRGMVQGFGNITKGALNGLGGVIGGRIAITWRAMSLSGAGPHRCAHSFGDTRICYRTSESCCFISKREDMPRC